MAFLKCGSSLVEQRMVEVYRQPHEQTYDKVAGYGFEATWNAQQIGNSVFRAEMFGSTPSSLDYLCCTPRSLKRFVGRKPLPNKVAQNHHWEV